MKTIKSLCTVLAVHALLSLAPLQAMEKENAVIEQLSQESRVPPLMELIFDYLIKLYDIDTSIDAQEQSPTPKATGLLMQLLHDKNGNIISLPAEITGKFLSYTQIKHPDFFTLGFPEKINLLNENLSSQKKYTSQDKSVFFNKTNDHAISLYCPNDYLTHYNNLDEDGEPLNKPIKEQKKISFKDSLKIIDIQPAKTIDNKALENSFYVLTAAYKKNSVLTQQPELYRIVYKVNLNGLQSRQKFPAGANWQIVKIIQESKRDLRSCSFVSLFAYLIAKQQPFNFIEQRLKDIVHLHGNNNLVTAFDNMLLDKKRKMEEFK